MRTLKDGKSCEQCGIAYPHFVLDYDHRPDMQKKANVNVLVKRGASKEILLAEIAKCDLVCANCHRFRTWERKGSSDKMAHLLENVNEELRV